MKYLLGTVAHILGVTKGTVRNYEKLGLIQSERDPQNNYRYYRFEDVDELRKIRSFRNMGFSLEEIRELMAGGDLETIERELAHKKKELAEEKRKLEIQLENVDSVKTRLGLLEKVGEITRVERPWLFWIPAEGEDEDEQGAWTEAMPDTSISPLFERKDGKMRARVGFCAEKEIFYRRKLPGGRYLREFSPCLCARQVIAYHAPQNDIYEEEIFEKMKSYLCDCGLKEPQEFIGRGIFTLGQGEERTFYAEIWSPL